VAADKHKGLEVESRDSSWDNCRIRPDNRACCDVVCASSLLIEIVNESSKSKMIGSENGDVDGDHGDPVCARVNGCD
jgi:hypothetical protein